MLARRAGRVVSTLLIAAGVLFSALLIVPAALGWQRYVIVSGSMTGTYDRGSLVLDDVVPTEALKAGDVITYKPPAGAGPEGLVTHRIASITTDKLGHREFRPRARLRHVRALARRRRDLDDDLRAHRDALRVLVEQRRRLRRPVRP